LWELFRGFCYQKACLDLAEILKRGKFEILGLVVKNSFEVRGGAVCGWDLCVKKYFFDVMVYEVRIIGFFGNLRGGLGGGIRASPY
jgi:hypothetical protein